MKYALLFLAVALLVPARSFANSVDISNSGGTLSGSNSGLALSGSIITSVSLNGKIIDTGNLGTVAFVTNQLISGSLKNGGVFAGDSGFLIKGNGNGDPNGPIFGGIFTSPLTWTEITLANGTHSYTLTGVLSGEWFAGQKVQGATVQLTVNTGTGFFTGKGIAIASGDTNFTGNGIRLVTPEPATLSLLGIGAVALAGAIRRRLASFAVLEN